MHRETWSVWRSDWGDGNGLTDQPRIDIGLADWIGLATDWCYISE